MRPFRASCWEFWGGLGHDSAPAAGAPAFGQLAWRERTVSHFKFRHSVRPLTLSSGLKCKSRECTLQSLQVLIRGRSICLNGNNVFKNERGILKHCYPIETHPLNLKQKSKLRRLSIAGDAAVAQVLFFLNVFWLYCELFIVPRCYHCKIQWFLICARYCTNIAVVQF